MNVAGAFGLLASVIVLAAFSMAIVNGGNTAKVIGAGANGVATIIRSATLR